MTPKRLAQAVFLGIVVVACLGYLFGSGQFILWTTRAAICVSGECIPVNEFIKAQF